MIKTCLNDSSLSDVAVEDHMRLRLHDFRHRNICLSLGSQYLSIKRGTCVKKCSCATRSQTAIFDLALLGEVFGILNWVDRLLDGQEGSQVGSVRWNHDERKEVPDACHCSRWHGPEEQERNTLSILYKPSIPCTRQPFFRTHKGQTLRARRLQLLKWCLI